MRPSISNSKTASSRSAARTWSHYAARWSGSPLIELGYSHRLSARSRKAKVILKASRSANQRKRDWRRSNSKSRVRHLPVAIALCLRRFAMEKMITPAAPTDNKRIEDGSGTAEIEKVAERSGGATVPISAEASTSPEIVVSVNSVWRPEGRSSALASQIKAFAKSAKANVIADVCIFNVS